jgi:hypothetical protein
MALSEVIKSFLGPSAQQKSDIPFPIRENDIFLVSYPRSGNTWMRFMIGNYLSGGKIDFINVHSFMPDMHYQADEVEKSTLDPRIIKSHFAFRPEFKNVIYLVRNGKDVAVSYYHFHRRSKLIPEDCTFADFLPKFNEGSVEFGKWSTHVDSWLGNGPDRFLFIRYEDLKTNPVGELIKICIFAKMEVDLERLRYAVEVSKFENMSKLDAEQPRRGIEPKDKDQLFVRAGGTNYDKDFDAELDRHFLDAHGATMKRLGYI